MLYFDGRKLKALRRGRGYTQADIAGLIGVSLRAYQKWEECESTPSATYFMRLMMVLGRSNVLWFASEHDPREEKHNE